MLIVKTKDERRLEIEKVIAQPISYTNFIGELDVHSVNGPFLDWLNVEVK